MSNLIMLLSMKKLKTCYTVGTIQIKLVFDFKEFELTLHSQSIKKKKDKESFFVIQSKFTETLITFYYFVAKITGFKEDVINFLVNI